MLYIPAKHKSAYIAGGSGFHDNYLHGKYFGTLLKEPGVSYVFRNVKEQKSEDLPPAKKIDLKLDWDDPKTFQIWTTRYIKGQQISKEMIHPQLLKYNEKGILKSHDKKNFVVGDIFRNVNILNLFHLHSVSRGKIVLNKH